MVLKVLLYNATATLDAGESCLYQFKQNLYKILPQLSRMFEVPKLKRCFVEQFLERLGLSVFRRDAQF